MIVPRPTTRPPPAASSPTYFAHPHTEGWGETWRTFLYAVIIAFGVRTFAYEPFNIPSGSMIPTLLVGDYLFVSKFSYGYSKYTFAFGVPPLFGVLPAVNLPPPPFDGRHGPFGHEPERGDVAVFKLPRDNKTDYIKRIIGLPGDTIQMRHGVLNINGAPVKLERIKDVVDNNSGGHRARIAEFLETLPGGKVHTIRKQSDNNGDNDPNDPRPVNVGDEGRYDNTQIFLVPPHHYFMMGDNRDNSSDSRVSPLEGGVGFVPEENLVGRAEFIFFSLNHETPFWEVWRWPAELRAERLFQGVN